MANKSKQAMIDGALGISYINEEGKEAKIPESEIARWRFINDLQMNGGFNKDKFIDKMIAGYLMDSETVRRFLVTEGLNNYRKLEDIIDEISKRVTSEHKTLCEEEIETMNVAIEAVKALPGIMESIIKISGAKTNKVMGLPNLRLPEGVAPQEAPNFYAVVNVNSGGANAEKPAVSVEQIQPEK